MPVTYAIDRERRLVLCVGTGVLSDEDSMEVLRVLEKDPDFDPTYNQLVDLREVTRMEVTSNLPHRVAAHHLWADDVKRAFLTRSEESFGLIRMYQMLADEEPGSIAIFRELDDALRWLEPEETRS